MIASARFAAPQAGQFRGDGDVVLDSEGRKQVEVLEDEAEVSQSHVWQLAFRKTADVEAVNADGPLLGLSSAPSIIRRVDFPDPDGPMIRTTSPGRTLSDTSSTATTSVSPAPNRLVT